MFDVPSAALWLFGALRALPDAASAVGDVCITIAVAMTAANPNDNSRAMIVSLILGLVAWLCRAQARRPHSHSSNAMSCVEGSGHRRRETPESQQAA